MDVSAGAGDALGDALGTGVRLGAGLGEDVDVGGKADAVKVGSAAAGMAEGVPGVETGACPASAAGRLQACADRISASRTIRIFGVFEVGNMHSSVDARRMEGK